MKKGRRANLWGHKGAAQAKPGVAAQRKGADLVRDTAVAVEALVPRHGDAHARVQPRPRNRGQVRTNQACAREEDAAATAVGLLIRLEALVAGAVVGPLGADSPCRPDP